MMAIWIVPSYLEFLHVGGMNVPLISIALFLIASVFAVAHRRHLTFTNGRVHGTFLFTWLIIFIFNLTVRFLGHTIDSSLASEPLNFEASSVIEFSCFVFGLSYVMTVLVFYDPKHLKDN
ncbi:hypothetical protein MOO44_04105 [Nicoliella spurrieriana]|uniref:Uncharacterized protein n=1 Tax=Nicoliella spurrieriana TaxID=2925830 RepID=A0A976X5U7_9LACO|nr:hypothetical protein [Nicoliella spurrieriana]UQS87343.1 hypothetical protein MOO44_04105 [Nicoliella spurrieriana]